MAELNNRITTGKVRFSYPYLFEPNKRGKYSISILIDKEDKKTLKAIEAAIEAAIELDGGTKLGKAAKSRKGLKLPLRDGDLERDDEAYEGMMFINANSNTPPQVVDRKVQQVIDPELVWPGCYGFVSLTFYAYDFEGTKGIAAGLNNVQTLSKGERIDNRVSASADFVVFSDEDDDEDENII